MFGKVTAPYLSDKQSSRSPLAMDDLSQALVAARRIVKLEAAGQPSSGARVALCQRQY